MRVCVLIVVGMLGGVSAVRAQAVAPACQDPAVIGALHQGGDACQKIVDVYNYMNVQIGTWIAGGNATLGQGSTLGGLGHITAELRVNAMRASIPRVSDIALQAGDAVSTTIPVERRWAGLPTADVAVGIFRGFPLGITHVGGLDALVNVAYVPDLSIAHDSVRIAPSGDHLKLGFGGRLGLIEETALLPGVSVTYLVRDVPTLSLVASDGEGNSISANDYDVRTEAWRAVVSKHFVILGLAAGLGQDRYRADANLDFDIAGAHPLQPIAFHIRPTRTNAFLDASLDLALLHIVAEGGRVSGGDATTFNVFDPAASAARYYGSLGVRIGL